MNIERTFSIIKPDATNRNLVGAITSMLEESNLRIIASKRIWMSEREAKNFYFVHKEQKFFEKLIQTITSGPVVLQILEGENAILKNRSIMGATNPSDAALGTIRKIFGLSISENSIHGSDSKETAKIEISYWFSNHEIFS